MDAVLHGLLLQRLEADRVDADAARMVIDACDAPSESARAVEPVWLQSIGVEGFRGIGPATTLELAPQPGLTVVVGRNGSGKSSFAEALELLLTGSLKRWVKRPKAWTDTWQCLHHHGATRLVARFVGGGQTVTLAREWARGAPYDDPAGRQAVDAAVAARGWAGALESFRPFLSYAELATMFETLTSLYDALSPVLGLADVDAVLGRLAARRLELDRRRKEASEREAALLRRLDPEEPRAAAVVAAIRSRRRDLDAIARLLRDAPAQLATAELRALSNLQLPQDDAIVEAFGELERARGARASATSAGAERASALALLLRQALAVRRGADCPVCGTAGVADEGWVTRAADRAAALDGQAAALSAADERVARAERAVGALLGAAGAGVDTAEGMLAAVARLRDERARACEALEELQAAWRESAGEIEAWLGSARVVDAEAAELKACKIAETWLKGAAADLRAERFAAIAERALENWRELRQGSSIELRGISLQKVGRGGRANFAVRADGEDANALGVMSQGELLALSLSVFLPRAALDESPFRFVVIDDPVQTLDAAKVDGLARVLERAAATRQVVVFTHDERLPAAIRRSRLPPTVLHLDRSERSSVGIRVG